MLVPPSVMAEEEDLRADVRELRLMVKDLSTKLAALEKKNAAPSLAPSRSDDDPRLEQTIAAAFKKYPPNSASGIEAIRFYREVLQTAFVIPEKYGGLDSWDLASRKDGRRIGELKVVWEPHQPAPKYFPTVAYSAKFVSWDGKGDINITIDPAEKNSLVHAKTVVPLFNAVAAAEKRRSEYEAPDQAQKKVSPLAPPTYPGEPDLNLSVATALDKHKDQSHVRAPFKPWTVSPDQFYKDVLKHAFEFNKDAAAAGPAKGWDVSQVYTKSQPKLLLGTLAWNKPDYIDELDGVLPTEVEFAPVHGLKFIMNLNPRNSNRLSHAKTVVPLFNAIAAAEKKERSMQQRK
jgi:hypothetical protein